MTNTELERKLVHDEFGMTFVWAVARQHRRSDLVAARQPMAAGERAERSAGRRPARGPSQPRRCLPRTSRSSTARTAKGWPGSPPRHW